MSLEPKQRKKRKSRVPNKSILNKYIQLVIEVVEEIKGFERTTKTTKNQIDLMSQYIDLQRLSSFVERRNLDVLKDAPKGYVTVWMMKAILDADLLRDLCLLPPVGVTLDQWRCFVSSCKDKCWDIIDMKEIGKLRRECRGEHEEMEGIEKDFFNESGSPQWAEHKEVKTGSHSFLLPVSALHESVRDIIVTTDGRFEPIVNNLFVCREHFKEIKGIPKEEREFYDRGPEWFSVELLNEELEKKHVEFSVNKTGLEKIKIGIYPELAFEYQLPRDPSEIEGLREEITRRIRKMSEDLGNAELVDLIAEYNENASGQEQE